MSNLSRICQQRAMLSLEGRNTAQLIARSGGELDSTLLVSFYDGASAFRDVLVATIFLF